MPEETPPVIVTRTEPGAAQTASRLRELGLEPVVSPALTLAGRNLALPDLSTFEGLIFTSANGVRFFAEATEDRSHAAWCVGPATASEALLEGFSPVLQSSGDAGDLAHYIAHHWSEGRPRRLLHIANAAAKGIVKETLAREGFDVEFLALYEARPASALAPLARALISSGETILVLIHSAKGASGFLSLADPQALLAASFVAVSEQAAKPLREAGLTQISVADHPDEDHLIAALQRVLAAR